MRRGFLANAKPRSSSNSKPPSRSNSGTAQANKVTDTGPAPVPSDPVDSDAQFQPSDTCRTYSDNPRIVVADFRHGAAPEASHFLYLPPDDSTIVFIDHLHTILQISRWDIWKQPAPSPPPDPLFALEHSTDKGMKMVARRPIRMGELIILERPLVVSRTDVAIAEDQSATGTFYRAALSGLSAATRASIMALHNCFTREQHEPVLGTLLTNQHPVTLPHAAAGGAAYSGLYPLISRANHDCAPSANFFFNTASFTGQLRAVRDIAAGAEITVVYGMPAAARAERRTELREHYNFVCRCATCELPPALAAQSDARRRAIGEMLPHMSQGVYAQDMSVACIEELLDWATQEGLYALYAQLLVYGYGLAAKLGAAALADRWSQMAVVAFRVLNGADSL
ncbi:hypothetical protein C8J57DRAFT_1460483 [Mycena rebaudengoi]|nr:hypothetical protein C8J57DRAFT_1460483 [Mycena rebaudengoi]